MSEIVDLAMEVLRPIQQRVAARRAEEARKKTEADAAKAATEKAEADAKKTGEAMALRNKLIAKMSELVAAERSAKGKKRLDPTELRARAIKRLAKEGA